MKNPIQPITTIPSLRHSLNPSPRRGGYLLLAIVFTGLSFGLSPTARAVDPPPDGGYPGENTAEGDNALFSLTTGIYNTANGESTLFANTTGFNNTAFGWHAVENNTTGGTNTGLGCDALENNATGSNNIGLGFRAGQNLTIGNNNVDIANRGIAGESNTIRIGTKSTHRNTFIAGISGATVAGGIGVIIDANGHLGTVVSSARFKDEVKPMDKASEAILALKPVTFRYKHELDPQGIRQFGLVAEQVEKVNPDLVARDEQGKVYSVRYEAVNAMLLNEFLKEHRKVEEQAQLNHQQKGINDKLESTAARQEQEIQDLTASLKEQAAQIQKVSERLEISKAAPRVAGNDR